MAGVFLCMSVLFLCTFPRMHAVCACCVPSVHTGAHMEFYWVSVEVRVGYSYSMNTHTSIQGMLRTPGLPNTQLSHSLRAVLCIPRTLQRLHATNQTSPRPGSSNQKHDLVRLPALHSKGVLERLAVVRGVGNPPTRLSSARSPRVSSYISQYTLHYFSMAAANEG